MPHDKVDEETAKCPMALDDIDLFEPGAQSFGMTHMKYYIKNLLFIRYPAKGTTKDTDGFIISKYEDIAYIVKDIVRFPPPVVKQLDEASSSGVAGFTDDKKEDK